MPSLFINQTRNLSAIMEGDQLDLAYKAYIFQYWIKYFNGTISDHQKKNYDIFIIAWAVVGSQSSQRLFLVINILQID